MALDALVPNDPRVEHKFKSFGDIKYHYVLAKPQGNPVGTALLVHGWPDLGFAWRFQVPYLTSLGLQVIVPDMLGYGQTSAPEPVEEYTMKKMTAHLAAIVKEVTDQPIILGGHDWGGFFVWRMYAYYPELIRAIFSLCVPYMPPSPVKLTLEDVVSKMPNFQYQLQLASGEAETILNKSPENIRAFMNGLLGGTTPEGAPVMKIEVGVIEENLKNVSPATTVSKEVIDFYVQEHSRNGFHGPCNWYRTRTLNADDDLELAKRPDPRVTIPAMLVMAEKDAALPPRLAEGQDKLFTAGLKSEVVSNAGHWVMIEAPEAVNKHIGDFVKSVLGDELKASL
ncbi:epoxide hydrolase [Annulohypoxylon maeteangense]|uniref:epoxide hydrolase n=1 Tax=Annulohypoxylon maeteangense TaxID=1927788 RepID=UPI002008BCE8|nr:epoxide hydrolase [Annulohypoxylon maeteangense]KAI0881872.1 epoxide hydrolase [Annulohypoxylon maeteangense]